MLPLIHPRDATAVTVRAPPQLRWLPPTDLRVRPASEGPVALEVDTAATITFLVEAIHLASPEANIRVEFDERLVRLQTGDQALGSGEVRPVAISASGTAQVVLDATATRYIDPGAPTQSTTLRVGVAAGEARTSTSVELTLPSPNEVALFATLASPRLPQRQYDGRGLLLQPYPNREHRYEFAVQNLSNRPKQVVAKFYAVPRPANAVWYPGALLGGGREPRPFAPLASWAAGSDANKRLLAVSAPVDLPGSSEPVRLVFARSDGVHRDPGRERLSTPALPSPNPGRGRFPRDHVRPRRSCHDTGYRLDPVDRNQAVDPQRVSRHPRRLRSQPRSDRTSVRRSRPQWRRHARPAARRPRAARPAQLAAGRRSPTRIHRHSRPAHAAAAFHNPVARRSRRPIPTRNLDPRRCRRISPRIRQRTRPRNPQHRPTDPQRSQLRPHRYARPGQSSRKESTSSPAIFSSPFPKKVPRFARYLAAKAVDGPKPP